MATMLLGLQTGNQLLARMWVTLWLVFQLARWWWVLLLAEL